MCLFLIFCGDCRYNKGISVKTEQLKLPLAMANCVQLSAASALHFLSLRGEPLFSPAHVPVFVGFVFFFRKVPREGLHSSQDCQKEMPSRGCQWCYGYVAITDVTETRQFVPPTFCLHWFLLRTSSQCFFGRFFSRSVSKKL